MCIFKKYFKKICKKCTFGKNLSLLSEKWFLCKVVYRENRRTVISNYRKESIYMCACSWKSGRTFVLLNHNSLFMNRYNSFDAYSHIILFEKFDGVLIKVVCTSTTLNRITLKNQGMKNTCWLEILRLCFESTCYFVN